MLGGEKVRLSQVGDVQAERNNRTRLAPPRGTRNHRNAFTNEPIHHPIRLKQVFKGNVYERKKIFVVFGDVRFFIINDAVSGGVGLVAVLHSVHEQRTNVHLAAIVE